MSKTYSDKLRDPRWQRKRLEIMERDEFTCQQCGDATKTLHVHHKYYLPRLEPWDYCPLSLVTLCEDCHQQEEEMKGMQVQFIQHLQHIGFLNTDFEAHNLQDNKIPLQTYKEVFLLCRHELFAIALTDLVRKHRRLVAGSIEEHLPF